MNINLTKSVRQILLVATSALFSASSLATVGIQNPPPNPGDIPDYFGVTGNYANSPQPVLTEVAIADDGKGGGATATATTNADGSIKAIQVITAGAGFISPQVTITDNATGGNGAVVSAVVGTTTSASTNPNGVITNFSIINGGSGYSANTIVNITDTAGSGASASVTVDNNGTITGVNVSSGGSGYVSPRISFNDPATGGTGAAAIVTGDGAGGISSLAVDNSQSSGVYSAQTTVLITDADTTNTLATGATADVIVTNGVITGLTVINPGSGYVTPVATITDPNYHASGSGASASAAVGTITTSTTAPDGVITGFTFTNGGSNYSSGATVQITDTTTPGGSGASAKVIVDLTGTITGFTDIVGGTGYVSPSVAIIDSPLGSGFTATVTTDATGLTGTLGEVTGFTITSAGSGYRLPTVSIIDNAPGVGGNGATAAATTYDYAASTPGAYTGGIQDVQVLNGGSHYTAATRVIVKGFGGASYTAANVIPNIVNGVITSDATHPGGFTIVHPGKGYDVPKPHTGLKKFVDLLPGIPGVSSYTSAAGYTNGTTNLGQALPLAVADTTTFPGSDYYVIAETVYTQKMHSDLPATHLRGYVQLKADGTPMGPNQYLGPIIVAQKERPVRVKLVNQLPTGVAGKLPFPVDHTYMGAADTAVSTNNTDNRTAMHLHGGNTPWISDGTPRQWIKPAGEAGAKRGVSAADVPDMWFVNGVLDTTAGCQGQTDPSKCAGGANNYPGDGALTFYYTNDQSARLMFYHDHAEGITRLNVYGGMAAGYLLQDPTEQDLINGTNNSGNNTAGYKVLPPLEDTIPLVIQEKTFVPDNIAPVLNFYGPFASQLNSSDPTWRWTSGAGVTGPNGNGDLWVPHVYMPNQNPGDISGANSFGRWDYGPWFWPPFTGITHGAVVNPYYDATCVSSVDNYCEGPTIPGVPNGHTLTVAAITALNYDPVLSTLGEPTGTPESFNDTSLVNGTVYPVLKVDPKQYRLRLLSVGNDRMLNLSLVVAASNTAPVTADQNAAPAPNTSVLCDGTTTVDRSLCTEARMVPFNATQHKVSKFPDWWYSPQKGGVTFDGRPSGVFDPATRGPAMVQIGTDGGFLSTPVVIKNQPVNFEYNLKNIVVTNVKEHALLLGPAERADVVVDFSNFAGATLLMYNDSPAPMPAFDLRLDYFTGDYDNTDTGGAFSTLPGYGPNTRTLMQIQVGGSGGSHPVDDTGTINLAQLTTAVQTAFRTSQEPIIVPQAAYNAVYNSTVTDSTLANSGNHDLALIQDFSLNFTPYASPATSGAVTASVLMDMQPKTIIEDWTMDYGRMNALLGVEIPKTSATTNTALPLADIDPPTELVKISPNDGSVVGAAPLTDGTQLWRITHNGVDSHAIHFHLFHVQIVNRVGWDGTIRQTEANELGWKDTVRMNPLEDVVVALRPKQMLDLPFKVPNSHHLLDPEQAAGGGNGFYNLDPQTGNASTVNNQSINYGWEYVWHCHILGHEENDMMRSIAVAQTPAAPTAVSATGAATAVTVSWIDNSIISNWVTIQRALDSGFTTGLTVFNVKKPECTVQAGCARSYVDKAVPVGTSVYYRVMANNTVGAGDFNGFLPPTLVNSLTAGFAGYDNVTAESVWSGVVSRLVVPTASVTAGPLAFGNQLVSTASAVQNVTINNSGTGNLTIAGVALTTGTNYIIITNNCLATLAPAANCTVGVSFKPTVTGALSDTLTITDNTGGVVGRMQTVALSGTGIAPVAGLSSSALTFATQVAGTTSTPAQTVTLSNTGTAPLTIASVTPTGPFVVASNTCGASLAVPVSPATSTTCTIGVTFSPTAASTAAVNGNNGTLTVTDNSNGVTGTTQAVTLSGTGVALNATTGLTASVVSATQVALNFTNTSSGETGYQVSGKFAAGAPVVTKAAVGTGSSATLTFALPTVTGLGYTAAPTVALTGVPSGWTCPAVTATVTTGAVSAIPTVTCTMATATAARRTAWTNATITASIPVPTGYSVLTTVPSSLIPALNASATATVTLPTLVATNYGFQVAPMYNTTVGPLSTATLNLAVAPTAVAAPAIAACSPAANGCRNLTFAASPAAMSYAVQYQLQNVVNAGAPGVTKATVTAPATSATLTFALPTVKGSGYTANQTVTLSGVPTGITCPTVTATVTAGSVSGFNVAGTTVTAITCTVINTAAKRTNWNAATISASIPAAPAAAWTNATLAATTGTTSLTANATGLPTTAGVNYLVRINATNPTGTTNGTANTTAIVAP